MNIMSRKKQNYITLEFSIGPFHSIWNIHFSLNLFPVNYYITIWKIGIRWGWLASIYTYTCILKKKKLLNCCFSFSNLWKKFYRIENKIHHTSINIILVNYNDIHKIYVQGNLLDAYSNVEEQNKTLNQTSGPGVCVVKRAVYLHVNHHHALEEPWLWKHKYLSHSLTWLECPKSVVDGSLRWDLIHVGDLFISCL